MARRLDYCADGSPVEFRLGPTSGSSAKVMTTRKRAQVWMTKEREVEEMKEAVKKAKAQQQTQGKKDDGSKSVSIAA